MYIYVRVKGRKTGQTAGVPICVRAYNLVSIGI